MFYREFRNNILAHMRTIPAGRSQAEYRMRLEMNRRGDAWPLFARLVLKRMAKRNEITRGKNTRSAFRSGNNWPTWGPARRAG